MGYQAHQREGIDDFVKAAGLARRRNNRVVVRTKRRGCVAHGQRAIGLVCADMREDPAIGVLGQRMMTLVDHHQPEGLRQSL